MGRTARKTTRPAKPAGMPSDQLRGVILARGLAANAVGVSAGVDPTSILRFLKAERSLSLESFDRACHALGLRLVETGRRRETGGISRGPHNRQTRQGSTLGESEAGETKGDEGAGEGASRP